MQAATLTDVTLNLNHRTVSRQADRALHRQLADAIRAGIDQGELRPGQALPSEGELAAAVGLSRTAVRDALDILAAEGRIVKRGGVPARVAQPPVVRHMATGRYADELGILREGGEHPLSSAFTREHGVEWADYTVGTDYRETPAGDVPGDALNLPPAAVVLRRHLIKYVAGDPVQLQTSYMPAELVGGTPIADPTRQPWPGGTIAELYSVGLVVTRVVEEAHARVATGDERRALDLSGQATVLEVVRTFYAGTRPVEVSVAVVPAAGSVLRYETNLT